MLRPARAFLTLWSLWGTLAGAGAYAQDLLREENPIPPPPAPLEKRVSPEAPAEPSGARKNGPKRPSSSPAQGSEARASESRPEVPARTAEPAPLVEEEREALQKAAEAPIVAVESRGSAIDEGSGWLWFLAAFAGLALVIFLLT